jgi:hypothetical protein
VTAASQAGGCGHRAGKQAVAADWREGQAAAGHRRPLEPRRRGKPHPCGDESRPAGRPTAARHGRMGTAAPQQAGRGGARAARPAHPRRVPGLQPAARNPLKIGQLLR